MYGSELRLRVEKGDGTARGRGLCTNRVGMYICSDIEIQNPKDLRPRSLIDSSHIGLLRTEPGTNVSARYSKYTTGTPINV